MAAEQTQDPLSQLLPPSEDNNSHVRTPEPGDKQMCACLMALEAKLSVLASQKHLLNTFLSTRPARTFTSVAIEIIAA